MLPDDVVPPWLMLLLPAPTVDVAVALPIAALLLAAVAVLPAIIANNVDASNFVGMTTGGAVIVIVVVGVPVGTDDDDDVNNDGNCD